MGRSKHATCGAPHNLLDSLRRNDRFESTCPKLHVQTARHKAQRPNAPSPARQSRGSRARHSLRKLAGRLETGSSRSHSSLNVRSARPILLLTFASARSCSASGNVASTPLISALSTSIFFFKNAGLVNISSAAAGLSLSPSPNRWRGDVRGGEMRERGERKERVGRERREERQRKRMVGDLMGTIG